MKGTDRLVIGVGKRDRDSNEDCYDAYLNFKIHHVKFASFGIMISFIIVILIVISQPSLSLSLYLYHNHYHNFRNPPKHLSNTTKALRIPDKKIKIKKGNKKT